MAYPHKYREGESEREILLERMNELHNHTPHEESRRVYIGSICVIFLHITL